MSLIKGVTAVQIRLLPSPLCTHTNTDALLCSSSSPPPPIKSISFPKPVQQK